jgi:hypothetical protein
MFNNSSFKIIKDVKGKEIDCNEWLGVKSGSIMTYSSH